MNTSETVESTAKNPFETTATEKETDVKAVETTAEEQKESSIYLGGKKFSTVDELAKYTETLERERYTAQTQQAPQPEAPKKKASELIFEDPDAALRLHEQEIVQKIRAEDQAKQAERQWWDGFYSKNKDLSEDRDLVDFAMNKHWDELRALHPDQAASRLADYTRETLVRFRKTNGNKQELPSGQARVASGNTGSAPKVQETKAAPVDFVSQLRKIQSKRK